MNSLTTIALPLIEDDRGKLSFGEIGGQLPFIPKRYFLVFDTGAGTVRGGHAHRRCGQFLIAVAGTVVVATDDGSERQEHRLDRPELGLHVPAGIWAEQHYLSDDARLLVLASEAYDPEEYISDYEEYLASRGKGQ
jgi:UDP-2-acetamido-3-amino-2,3-dideoxy-glucuronate N-acetyltransferase